MGLVGLATEAFAHSVIVHSLQDPAFARRGFDARPWTYADGIPIRPGERLRLVAVRASDAWYLSSEERAAVRDGTATVTLDALGNVVPVGFPVGVIENEELEAVELTDRQVVFGERNGHPGETVVAVASGLPEGSIGTATETCTVKPDAALDSVTSVEGVAYSAWSINPPDVGANAQWWLFLIVEDTRQGEGMAPDVDSPARAGVTAAVVMNDCSTTLEPQATPLLLGMFPVQGMTAYVSAPAVPMGTPCLPAAVTAASGTTYDPPAQIEALISPTLSGLEPASDPEGGAEGFRLTLAETADGKPVSRQEGEPVPDGLLYSVFTASSLAGPWEPLDDAIAQKSLATRSEKRYTRVQLSDLRNVFLPKWDDTRFYRIQQSTTAQGE